MDKPVVSTVARAAAKEQLVSLVVDDVPVARCCKTLAEMQQKNLVVAPDVSGTVSLHLKTFPGSRHCAR